MLAKSIAAAVALAVLGGCAGETAGTQFGADHPANPQAPAAPVPPPSKTLALNPTSAPSTRPVETAAVYTCPHHPDVTSTDPEARCPKCGMKLVPKTAGGSHEH